MGRKKEKYFCLLGGRKEGSCGQGVGESGAQSLLGGHSSLESWEGGMLPVPCELGRRVGEEALGSSGSLLGDGEGVM